MKSLFKLLKEGFLSIGYYATTEIQYIDREKIEAEIKKATENGFAQDKANLRSDMHNFGDDMRKAIKKLGLEHE